ncbi:hypothetical protein BD769DRAFT_1387500 [Suillus cothurnatus]|nr:hypothetical protein BD769DRAFT_1387500 [Suillus cothurnatus]
MYKDLMLLSSTVDDSRLLLSLRRNKWTWGQSVVKLPLSKKDEYAASRSYIAGLPCIVDLCQPRYTQSHLTLCKQTRNYTNQQRTITVSSTVNIQNEFAIERPSSHSHDPASQSLRSTVSVMSHINCDLPGLYLVLQQTDTPALRFSTYRNCTCLTNMTTEYPIVDLSDTARKWQDRMKLKGIIFFFFDDAAEGYALADLFNEE